jgi:hypothetical protein
MAKSTSLDSEQEADGAELELKRVPVRYIAITTSAHPPWRDSSPSTTARPSPRSVTRRRARRIRALIRDPSTTIKKPGHRVRLRPGSGRIIP